MLVIVGIQAALILAALSFLAVGVLGGGFTAGGPASLFGSSCSVPNLSGAAVNVPLTNIGGPMMGGRDGTMFGGAMRLSADHATVQHGTVSFLVTNGGSITHEMVVLPLPGSQVVGTRPIGGDAKIDETGSRGEKSNTCGEGAGQGILPDASSWVSVTVEPDRYKLVCNFPGHYAAGMYTQLTVN